MKKKNLANDNVLPLFLGFMEAENTNQINFEKYLNSL